MGPEEKGGRENAFVRARMFEVYFNTSLTVCYKQPPAMSFLLDMVQGVQRISCRGPLRKH